MVLNDVIFLLLVLADGIQFLLNIDSDLAYELLGVKHLHGFAESDDFDQIQETTEFELKYACERYQGNEVVPKFRIIEIYGDFLEISNWVDRICGLVFDEKLENHMNQKENFENDFTNI